MFGPGTWFDVYLLLEGGSQRYVLMLCQGEFGYTTRGYIEELVECKK